MKGYYENNDLTTKYLRTQLIINPVTQLKWNQTSPYNSWVTVSCPDLHWTYEGKAPAGCTPVAVAQIVAYLCPPAIKNDLKLESLRKISSFVEGTTDQSYGYEIGNLMRSAGYWTEATYDCDGTGAQIRNLRDQFDSWGVEYSYVEDDNVDLGRLGYNLYKGYPHLTSGFTKRPTVVGHTWVWEGIYCYIEKVNSSTKKIEFSPNSTIQLWCNWGWGGYDDGWFIDFERPHDYESSFLDDNCQLYIEGTIFPIPQ